MAIINWSENKTVIVRAKPEIQFLEKELLAQKEYNVQLESTVLELADMVLLSSLM